MKRLIMMIGFIVACTSGAAVAQLAVYEDYDLGKEITWITTVKVDANMEDYYLEGLRSSWIKAVSIQKELGYIKDWKILGSDLPQSGDFNMLLMVTFATAEDSEPNQKRYNAFMKKWGEEAQQKSREIAKTYPDVRTLTGEYRMREIIIK